jgi:hypothetical protein
MQNLAKAPVTKAFSVLQQFFSISRYQGGHSISRDLDKGR